MRTFNLRLGIILLVIVVASGIGIYFLHNAQVLRNADVFKREADKARARAEEAAKAKDATDEKDAIKDCIRSLGWYTRLRPDDIAALEELGLLQADNADSSRTFSLAFSMLERVLRQDPERKNVRRRVVDLAMMAGRFADAKEHLEQFLLKEEPENGELRELLGQCYVGTKEYDLALDAFKQAIDVDPSRIQAYSRRASVLRYQTPRAKEADEWMDKMVKANPKSDQAHFLRGDYLLRLDRDEDAYKDALVSLELAPDNHDGLWLAAQCCLAMKELPKARDYANRAIKLNPSNIIMYNLLADIERQDGDAGKAVAALQEGLKATARNPQLLFHLANLQIDIGNSKEAEKTIQDLRKTAIQKQLIEYLVARNHFVQNHWREAREGFEKVRGSLIQWPPYLKQVDYWIGVCYGQLGNRDLQMVAYKRALVADANFAPARAGLMELMRSSGDADGALKEYQALAKDGKLGSGSLIPYAEMLIQQMQKEPAARQDWAPALKVLDDAEKANPDNVRVPMLRAEILVAQNRIPDAEKLLEDARRRNPGQASLWMVLAQLAERQQNWTKAEQLIDEAQRRWGDTVAQRLAVAQLLAKRHGKNATDRIRKLNLHTDRFNESERKQLRSGLLNAAMMVGDTEFATEICSAIAKEEPNNVQVRFLLFEQAVRADDEAAMEKALKEVERVAGRGAYWHYGLAVQLSMKAKDKKSAEQDRLLEQALDHLTRAREQRENWSRIPLLTAGINDQQGKVDDALKNYLEAIEMGERDANAVQRTVQLLFQKQRYGEADRLIQQLNDQKMPLSNDLSRSSAEAAMRGGDYGRALEMARKAVSADSKRYQEHLWLGQMLTMIGRKAKTDGQAKKATELLTEAEKVLRRAVEVEPKVSATWVALIQFLSANEKEDQAEKLIPEATKSIPAKEAPLAIAQCYEVMGKAELAQQKYEAALQAGQQDPLVLRSVADYYCRVAKLVEAEALLRQIIDGKVKAEKGDVAWARRQLAQVILSRPGYKNIQKARELVEQNLAADEASVLDRQLMARIDAADPDPAKRRKGMQGLKGLEAEQAATPEDLFRLAQMYRGSDAWTESSTLFRKLLTASGNEPRYLAAYISALLEHNESTNAEAYLERLEAALPNQMSSVGLRAELLVAKGEPDKSLALLSEFLDKSGAKPTERNVRIRLVAEKIEQLARQLNKSNQTAAADRFVQRAELLLREFIDKYAQKTPGRELILVAFLARNGRIDAALDLLQRTWETGNPAILSQVCSTVLKSDKAGKQQLQRLEELLKLAEKRYDRPVPLMMIHAELCSKLARFVDAETLYREILQKTGSNAYALNNLAVLLALQGIKLDDATTLIAQAIEIAGPVGAMLDSRATIYLAKGETDKALADLADAVADAETPVRLFHQAVALEKAGKSGEAATSMEKALQKGLTKEMLHPLEAPAFDRLKQAVK
jgi:tetratricopeptide (TPR) repeat protein